MFVKCLQVQERLHRPYFSNADLVVPESQLHEFKFIQAVISKEKNSIHFLWWICICARLVTFIQILSKRQTKKQTNNYI